MELTPQVLLVVLPLIFLGGFVDSVAGGGGLITARQSWQKKWKIGA